MTYHPGTTALLLVDPYKDFLSEGGKAWLGYHVTLVKDATADLQSGGHARRTRYQRADLRPRYHHHR